MKRDYKSHREWKRANERTFECMCTFIVAGQVIRFWRVNEKTVTTTEPWIQNSLIFSFFVDEIFIVVGFSFSFHSVLVFLSLPLVTLICSLASQCSSCWELFVNGKHSICVCVSVSTFSIGFNACITLLCIHKIHKKKENEQKKNKKTTEKYKKK